MGVPEDKKRVGKPYLANVQTETKRAVNWCHSIAEILF